MKKFKFNKLKTLDKFFIAMSMLGLSVFLTRFLNLPESFSGILLIIMSIIIFYFERKEEKELNKIKSKR